jgi:hypothetical protein
MIRASHETEAGMRMERRVFLLSVTLAAATATAAMGQTVTSPAGLPWTATITYARDPAEWREVVCAENRYEYYNKKESEVPRADKPDF